MKRYLAIFTILAASLQASLFFTPPMISSHLSSYTSEEVELIEKDLEAVRSVCFEPSQIGEKPLFLATAGGPGARKTTILEKFISKNSDFQKCAYIDPDPRALKFMIHTYYDKSLNALEISKAESYQALLKGAYEKWRGGSNYIVLTLMEEAFSQKRSIAYGTTATGGHISQFLPKVREAGYHLTLLLCGCDDDFRRESITYRNEIIKFYQSSPEDAVGKGKLFALRMETYFKEADELFIYWSDSLSIEETLAATLFNGELQVVDPVAFEKFATKYETDRLALFSDGVDLISFEEILSKYTL